MTLLPSISILCYFPDFVAINININIQLNFSVAALQGLNISECKENLAYFKEYDIFAMAFTLGHGYGYGYGASFNGAI